MDFKTAKEIVLALKEIAKNIQGDKSSNTNNNSDNKDESNDVYDGILKINDGTHEVMLSFGIKDNDNATKLGDLFTDNFINDLNNDENITFVSTVSKLNNEIIRTRGHGVTAQFIDGSVQFENDGTNFIILILDHAGQIKLKYRTILSRPFTKDTPLEKVSD